MTPRCFLDHPKLILRTSFFHDFHDFQEVSATPGWSRHLQKKLNIPSERASKMMGSQIENDSFG